MKVKKLFLLTGCMAVLAGGCAFGQDKLEPEKEQRCDFEPDEEAVEDTALTDLDFPEMAEAVEEARNYSIYRLEDGRYLYEIRNFEGSVIYRDILYKYPSMTVYDTSYLEVHWGAGTSVWMSRYFDLENCFMTEPLMCVHYVQDGTVASVDVNEGGERILLLYNPFSYSEYGQKVAIDFAPESVVMISSDCLQEITQKADGKIAVVYLNREGKREEICLSITDGGEITGSVW